MHALPNPSFLPNWNIYRKVLLVAGSSQTQGHQPDAAFAVLLNLSSQFLNLDDNKISYRNILNSDLGAKVQEWSQTSGTSYNLEKKFSYPLKFISFSYMFMSLI